VSLRLARVLQLASPALPIGAYSYSSGLESALDEGLVHDDDSAFEWIADALELVQARHDAAIVAAAARTTDIDELRELDVLVLAGRETAELRLEAEQMGYSLGQWMEQVVPGGESPVAASAPVVFGMAAARLGLSPRTAAASWLWGFAENQVMVLIKAMPIGQVRGQRLLWRLGVVVARAAAQAARLPRDAWSNAMPGLAIASMRHEEQYSRLFRS
jgi:urease accessory protein